MEQVASPESDRCLTDDDVASLVEGRLATDERVRIERHLGDQFPKICTQLQQ
jgi:hypothetical protein